MATIKKELKSTLKIALPLIGVYVGHQFMGLVDTIIIGRVGTAELGAVGVGASFFGGMNAVCIGLLMGLETLISQSVGGNRHKDADRLLIQGILLSVFCSILMMAFIFLFSHFFEVIGTTPAIAAHTKTYLNWATWSLFPNLLFVVLMKYWQSYQITLPATLIMILGNIINIFCDLAFVLGKFGFPKLDVLGVAFATFVSRFGMILLLIAYTVYKKRKMKLYSDRNLKFKVNFEIQKKLLKLGIPAGLQISLEFGAFVIVTLLAAKLGEVQTAAHHIALTVASISFMVPLSFSSAAATRVGLFIGAKNYAAARTAGWVPIILSSCFMCLTAIIFISFPSTIYSWFHAKPDVLAMGKTILIMAGIFQVFDGIQVTATGSLRGIGDTKTSMFANLIGHYPCGLLVGVILCFGYDLGLKGLWIGLITGLMSASLILLYAWKYASTKLDVLQEILLNNSTRS